jgi:hypothetical protein
MIPAMTVDLENRGMAKWSALCSIGWMGRRWTKKQQKGAVEKGCWKKSQDAGTSVDLGHVLPCLLSSFRSAGRLPIGLWTRSSGVAGYTSGNTGR